MKRVFALPRGKYGFFDPVTRIHLTAANPVTRELDDEQVDVRGLERAAALGSLIDLSPPPQPAPAHEPELFQVVEQERRAEPEPAPEVEAPEESEPQEKAQRQGRGRKKRGT